MILKIKKMKKNILVLSLFHNTLTSPLSEESLNTLIKLYIPFVTPDIIVKVKNIAKAIDKYLIIFLPVVT